MLLKDRVSCAGSEVDGIGLRGRKRYPDAFLSQLATVGRTWGPAFRESQGKDIGSPAGLRLSVGRIP